ncbi:hypothetical protein AB0P21_40710 [Kribbella sp. NPDC056861]|uniref:hypothetical protein n=1 Tax=Kribbella sp. NPDC056861 TaxID=3154857 RepID=UPI003420F8C4
MGGIFGDPHWWSKAKPITDLRLEAPDKFSPAEIETSGARGWQQALFICAAYRSNDEPKQWGYVLVRNTANERWSITDEGPG